MNAPSEMYPIFESPFPTILTHTDRGLGIFVAHPKVAMNVHHIGLDHTEFRVKSEELNFAFPLKTHACALLQRYGGLMALTDDQGMPWYTMELPISVGLDATFASVRETNSRSTFGRPMARNPLAGTSDVGTNDEGDFGL